MNKKSISRIRAFAMMVALVLITTVNTSCSNNKLSKNADTGGSASQNEYNASAEGALIAPAASANRQDASMAVDLPAKAYPVENISEKDVKIKKDRAIEIAKTMLEDPSLYTEGNAFLSPLYDICGTSGASWIIDFSGNSPAGSNVNVTIDANSGKIMGYNNWNADDSQQAGKEPMTREQAVALAEKMLKDRFNISIGNYEIQNADLSVYGLKMPERKGSQVYSFNYTRVVNGVLFPFETINISVDGVSGQLRSFYHNESRFDLAKLPSKDGAISPEEALEQYRNAVNMSLQYITLYQEKPKAVLVYAPTSYINMLDAFSGKPVNYDGLPYDMPNDALDRLVPLNPEAGIGTSAISVKEAEALADKYRKLTEKHYGVEFDLGPYAERYQQADDDIWSVNWSKNDEKHSYSIFISINLKTGHIVNLSLSKYEHGGVMPMEAEIGKAAEGFALPSGGNSGSAANAEVKPEAAPSAAQDPAIMPAPAYIQEPVVEKVGWSAGKEKAIEFLKEMLPETYGFYADSNSVQPALPDEAMKYTREHNYAFVRVANGIAYRENCINISVDRETGEIRSMYYSWSDLELRKPNGVIGADTAENKFFGDMEAKLSYHLITSYDNSTGKVTDVKPVLVYNFSSKRSPYAFIQYVDAFTGESVGDNYMLLRDAVSSSFAE